MDLYCPKCGEPWDNECFHDEASESNRTYTEVARDFAQRGCVALETAYGPVGEDCKANQRNSNRAHISEIAFDLMGDDTDGVASMMQDAEYLGLI